MFFILFGVLFFYQFQISLAILCLYALGLLFTQAIQVVHLSMKQFNRFIIIENRFFKLFGCLCVFIFFKHIIINSFSFGGASPLMHMLVALAHIVIDYIRDFVFNSVFSVFLFRLFFLSFNIVIRVVSHKYYMASARC